MTENPIPKHLRPIFEFRTPDRGEVIGDIRCTCNSTSFAIHYVADSSSYATDQFVSSLEINDHFFTIVYAQCNHCQRNHLLFDIDFHGYDGFVCTDHTDLPPRPAPQR